MLTREKKHDKPERRGQFTIFHGFSWIRNNAAIVKADQTTRLNPILKSEADVMAVAPGLKVEL